MTTYDSTITTKFQATIPKAVRLLLGISQGDHLAYDVDEEAKIVQIRKAVPLDLHYTKSLEGTLSEWSSDFDEESYRDL